MAYFDAKHDGGTEWKLAVPSKGKTAEYVNTKAILFVRNYCLKNCLHKGGATITAEDGSILRFEGLYS